MDLDSALQTFIAEATDLGAQMEDALLHLESVPDDSDILNALFRTAHTIKGSAGLFGLDAIVDFTHIVENILDRLRSRKMALTPELIALLLECRDHILDLVDVVASRAGTLDSTLKNRDAALCARLNTFNPETPVTVTVSEHSTAETLETGEALLVTADTWHISIRFNRDVLRDGMDPLSFLRYLATRGDVVAVHTLFDAMPQPVEMDPEACYIGLEIRYRSDESKDTIAGIFEFLEDGSLVRILPPHSRISDYIDLISELPEDDLRIGALLVASGALTNAELENGLAAQHGGFGRHDDTGDSTAPDMKPLGEILVHQGVVHQEVVDAALEKQAHAGHVRSGSQQHIRIRSDKLDQLINLVGELVVAGASTSIQARASGMPELQESASILSRLVENIRDSALALRMVQIGDTFNRFPRIVRDLSRNLDKDISLSISGSDTELDKTVIERITDPLTHLVRNSIDHGIEAVDLRLQRGKPAQGNVRLNAYHEAGNIIIEVTDDGNGLDRSRILDKAISNGLAEEGRGYSDAEVFNFIFSPGFSTASAVTNISGRGVGMDVVRRNIDALRGTIDVDSEPGSGTKFRIRLPLTLAIIDGFLMRVCDTDFVVPLDMVVECLELPTEGTRGTLDSGLMSLRGEPLPTLGLANHFGFDRSAGRRRNVVVVQQGVDRAGLVVDELLGEIQTVIKPMNAIFRSIPGISGSTILGTGNVALILDAGALIQQAMRRDSRRSLAGPGRSASIEIASR